MLNLGLSKPGKAANSGQTRPRKCKQCRGTFYPARPLQSACTWECAQILAATLNAKKVIAAKKAEAKKDRARKEAVKTRSEHQNETQKAFNAYIRARDESLPCISCGRMHEGQWHAGHYLSVGARPELRFDEDNVHKQCQPCNTHLHGNLVNYRVGLGVRRGDACIGRLEGPSAPKKYTIGQLQELKAHYRALTRQRLKERG